MSASVLDRSPVIDGPVRKDLPEAAYRLRTCQHTRCKNKIPAYVGRFCSEECSVAEAEKRKANMVVRTAYCCVCVKRVYANKPGDTPPRTCSNKCRKVSAKRRAEGKPLPMLGRCLLCDTRTESKEGANNPPSYCSTSCRNEAVALRKSGQPMPVFPDEYTKTKEDYTPVEGNCLHCDGQTIASGPGSMAPLYCSTICKRLYKAHQIKSQLSAQCLNCEKTFARDYEDSVHFCSASCRRNHLQVIKEKWEAANKRAIMHCSDYRHKIRHLTVFHAYEAIDRYCDENLNAYYCFTCGAYHIGHPRGYEHEFIPRPATYPLFQVYRKANTSLVNLTKRALG